jgi:hypothetical protein
VSPAPTRRLVITVCPQEPGMVLLPLRPGERRRRLGARAIARHLAELAVERGVSEVVEIRSGCAGGCWLKGPNVSVALYPVTPPGQRPDHVAIAWKTYVASLAELDCLATIIDENLPGASEGPSMRGGR